MAKKKRKSDCPIHFALEMFGDKWSLLIIRDLMFKGKKTYSDFLASEEKIATNILADRLIMLEEAGLIKSTMDKDYRSKFNYTLTEKGIALVPVLLEIIKWSAEYDPGTAAPKEFVERVKNDREKLIEETTSQLNNK